ncbi:MAG: carbon starvation protein A [Dehalococcoidia bacterium]|nr:MAG: carbon starvation protein A [Dehalococcoidia bacterium]
MRNGAAPVIALVVVVVALALIMAALGWSNTLVAVILGAIVVVGGYKLYATTIDRKVIQADPRRATPARLYMDGVDFVPTSRNVLYGYHFKSVAAAGPIVGAITAGALWGWLPSLLWLALGVIFIGWASDYSAIVLSVRNDGNTMSATAHRLVSPRTRTILFVFTFFYLLLIAGAFGNLIAGVLVNPSVPLGIIALAVMGVVAGQMLYRLRMDLIVTTVITVGITLLAILAGGLPDSPVAAAFTGLNNALNSLTGGQPVVTVLDPTRPANQQLVPILPSFVFWLIATFVFCYFGAVLPIWRYAQPVNYIGFWITGLTIVLGGLGAALAIVVNPEVAAFKVPAFRGFQPVAGPAIQPLWPMLFVTIACGAISGWHALIGSVSTARQIENESDMLPVGGGAMFSEFTLGLLSLLAIATVAQGAGAPAFAAGVAGFLSVFGIPRPLGTALAFAAFVVIVITVTQLVFRVMRVVLAESLGERMPIFRNMHFDAVLSMVLTFLLVMSGTWVYLWQLFGGANQLMAALSLLLVTVWLVSTRRNPLYAGIPFLFMYVTTIAALLVTVYNLYASVIVPSLGVAGREIAIAGAGAMILVGLLLVVAALFIGYDGWRAIQRYRERPLEMAPTPAPTG